jgi:hypothetical protein
MIIVNIFCMKVVVISGADPGCVGSEVYTVRGALFLKNNTKLRIRIRYECEYLFGAPPHPWEGRVQVRGIFINFTVNPPPQGSIHLFHIYNYCQVQPESSSLQVCNTELREKHQYKIREHVYGVTRRMSHVCLCFVH